MNRFVTHVNVKDVEKRYQPSRCYMYIIEAVWSDDTKAIVYRSYSDFFTLQILLTEYFPIEAGEIKEEQKVLPDLPGNRSFLKEDMKTAGKRVAGVSKYCTKLLELVPKISRHASVVGFFEFRPEDISPPKDRKVKKSGGLFGGFLGKKKNRQAMSRPPSVHEISIPLPCDTYTAITDFKGKGKGQLSFEEGDVVDVIDKNCNGWWFVSCGGSEGWAPATYLEAQYGAQEDEDVCLQGVLFITTSSFTGDLEDEITIGAGVVIEVMNKVLDGWWVISYNGKVGYLPSTYLQPYTNEHLSSKSKAAKPVTPVPRRQTVRMTAKRDLTIYRKASEKRRKRTAKKVLESLDDKISPLFELPEEDEYHECLQRSPGSGTTLASTHSTNSHEEDCASYVSASSLANRSFTVGESRGDNLSLHGDGEDEYSDGSDYLAPYVYATGVPSAKGSLTSAGTEDNVQSISSSGYLVLPSSPQRPSPQQPSPQRAEKGLVNQQSNRGDNSHSNSPSNLGGAGDSSSPKPPIRVPRFEAPTPPSDEGRRSLGNGEGGGKRKVLPLIPAALDNPLEKGFLAVSGLATGGRPQLLDTPSPIDPTRGYTDMTGAASHDVLCGVNPLPAGVNPLPAGVNPGHRAAITKPLPSIPSPSSAQNSSSQLPARDYAPGTVKRPMDAAKPEKPARRKRQNKEGPALEIAAAAVAEAGAKDRGGKDQTKYKTLPAGISSLLNRPLPGIPQDSSSSESSCDEENNNGFKPLWKFPPQKSPVPPRKNDMLKSPDQTKGLPTAPNGPLKPKPADRKGKRSGSLSPPLQVLREKLKTNLNEAVSSRVLLTDQLVTRVGQAPLPKGRQSPPLAKGRRPSADQERQPQKRVPPPRPAISPAQSAAAKSKAMTLPSASKNTHSSATTGKKQFKSKSDSSTPSLRGFGLVKPPSFPPPLRPCDEQEEEEEYEEAIYCEPVYEDAERAPISSSGSDAQTHSFGSLKAKFQIDKSPGGVTLGSKVKLAKQKQTSDTSNRIAHPNKTLSPHASPSVEKPRHRKVNAPNDLLFVLPTNTEQPNSRSRSPTPALKSPRGPRKTPEGSESTSSSAISGKFEFCADVPRSVVKCGEGDQIYAESLLKPSQLQFQ